MLKAWNASSPIIGRAITGGIFEQGNRFGPQVSIFEHFAGWFDAPKAEHLQLSAMSNDASFVLVDGKEVVEAPGFHTFHQRHRDEFVGAIDLAAGSHLLEDYYAYVPNHDPKHFLLCGLEASTMPKRWMVLTGNSSFFKPIGHAHIVDYQLESSAAPASRRRGKTPALAIDWIPDGQKFDHIQHRDRRLGEVPS